MLARKATEMKTNHNQQYVLLSVWLLPYLSSSKQNNCIVGKRTVTEV